MGQKVKSRRTKIWIQKELRVMLNELPTVSGHQCQAWHSDTSRRGMKSLGTDIDNQQRWPLSHNAFPLHSLSSF